ncbi:MAG: pyridoxal-dependent decarboxylase [Pseudomonadota bacterium]
MKNGSKKLSSETLDPEDWEETRRIGHQMVDDMIDYVRTVRERPAWRSVPAATKSALSESLPRDGAPLATVYEQFKNHILPFPTGNLHPGFFGWVMGNGTVTGMLADMLASGMNPHVAGYDQSAAIIERQVISWLSELLGFPDDASGLFVTGGTMANLNGLAVARNEKAGFDFRKNGFQETQTPKLRVYGGIETHNWIYKACELMGLGRSAFRALPVNENYQIDVDACRASIEKDIRSGDKPFCIVGTAGTVNTGAIDDLVTLRALCDEFDLWFHVDGAFGSLAALSDQSKALVAGQETADSIAFDLHKWGYMPYDVGCVLVRHKGAQNATFEQKASYLNSAARGLSVETTYFADKGVQLSRSFRALKVWMSLKEQGADKLGRLIQQNIDQARYLETLAIAHPELEVLAPVTLNIVCFRYRREDLSDDVLNAMNQEVLLRLQESGSAVPSQTVLKGKFAIRVCVTNHRSRQEDFDRLAGDAVQHAHDVIAEG